MTKLTLNELSEYSFTGRVDINTSVTRFKGSSDKVKVVLDIGFVDELLSNIIPAAAKTAVVPAQNHRIRPHFDDYENGQRVKVDWNKPATVVVDPEVAMIQRLKAMDSPEEKERYIKELLAKAVAPDEKMAQIYAERGTEDKE